MLNKWIRTKHANLKTQSAVSLGNLISTEKAEKLISHLYWECFGRQVLVFGHWKEEYQWGIQTDTHQGPRCPQQTLWKKTKESLVWIVWNTLISTTAGLHNWDPVPWQYHHSLRMFSQPIYGTFMFYFIENLFLGKGILDENVCLYRLLYTVGLHKTEWFSIGPE